jgi:hypothetical protein
MNKQDSISLKKFQQKYVSRRNLLRGAAGAALETGLLRSNPAYAWQENDDQERHGPMISPIPGGGAPFKPFGVIVHHNPLKPGVPVASISDPSQINDFEGIVGLTHIRGGGTGTDTTDNETQHFQGTFLSTGATIKWSAKEDGFQFESEAPDPNRNIVSVLGREKNGVFFA